MAKSKTKKKTSLLGDWQWSEPELCAFDKYGFDGSFQPWPRTGFEEKSDMKSLLDYYFLGNFHAILM